jgi:hypothetical protein
MNFRQGVAPDILEQPGSHWRYEAIMKSEKN